MCNSYSCMYGGSSSGLVENDLGSLLYVNQYGEQLSLAELGLAGMELSFLNWSEATFGTTEVWVPGHEVPYGDYVSGHWETIQFGTGVDSSPNIEMVSVPAPNKPSTISCTGKAYVLAGNPSNVGKQGFPGVTVTNGSAAVIPSQWTGQRLGGPLMRAIGAGTYGAVWNSNYSYAFEGITQAIDYSALGTSQQVQSMIEARAPGQLVLEVVGGVDHQLKVGGFGL